MNPNRLRAVTRRLAATPRSREPTTDTDPELLGRFLDRHDEAAFAELVRRHLPAVCAVCRSVLRDANDADDAAQAAFLILVRRAETVRDRDALGGWLYRVAWRAANRLRTEKLRRAAIVQPGADPNTTAAKTVAHTPSDTRSAVEEEIGRLPEQYRLAVVTCYTAEVSTTEAAQRLGWPKGTLLTRLAWARKRLRDRLTRRGVTLAGGFTTVLAGRTSITAAVLAGTVVRTGVAVVTDDPAIHGLVSERVFSLTEGVLRTMAGTKFKVLAAVTVAAVALLGVGLGSWMSGEAVGANPPQNPLADVIAKADAQRAAQPEPYIPPTAVEAPTDQPGNVLVVHRPRGSFTKEVAPFGKITATFTEDRLFIRATAQIEQISITINADADYSMNRESMVYGIISSVEVTAPLGIEEAASLSMYSGLANDMPFAFRIRVDEETDSVTIKDIRFGAIGSPMFTQLLGEAGGDPEEVFLILNMICGKYHSDAQAERGGADFAPARSAPRKRK